MIVDWLAFVPGRVSGDGSAAADRAQSSPRQLRTVVRAQHPAVRLLGVATGEKVRERETFPRERRNCDSFSGGGETMSEPVPGR